MPNSLRKAVAFSLCLWFALFGQVGPVAAQTTTASYAGTYSGTFSGGDSGSFTAQIASNGSISVTGNSSVEGALSGSGQVSSTGSLEMTAGSTSTGSTFSGTIDPASGTLSGTWSHAEFGVNGSFSGTRTSAPVTTTTITSTTTTSTTVASTTTTTQAAGGTGVPLNLNPGWNLLGNSSAMPIDVAVTFSDATKITSVWKWIQSTSTWAFYAPSMSPSALTAYVQGKGYDVLTSIAPKEGFWVNASTAAAIARPPENRVALVDSDLHPGWNLVGSADNRTPSQLNQDFSSGLNASGKAMVTAWAWDAPNAAWKFYAPALEAQGGMALADYIASKGYLPFSTALSRSDGFWMNVGATSPSTTACGAAGGAVFGIVSLGPVSSATVSAFGIAGGAKGALLANATTDAAGQFSVQIGAYTGPVLFEATGGTYTDQATGTARALTTPLHSMLSNVTGGATCVAVTALTELAYQLANISAGGLTATNIQTSVASVQANFGVADIINTMPVDALNVPAGATTAQKTYALALATVSQYQTTQPAEAGLAQALQTIQTCLAAPTTGCGAGATSVITSLDAALSTFLTAHPSLAGVTRPVADFGTVPSPGQYETVTVAGLNRRSEGGTLVLGSFGGVIETRIDTLNIASDGTYTFATAHTSDARWKRIIQQPAGQSCKATKHRQDRFDPYTGQLITQTISDYYCFEDPCGNLLSLGLAPAPKGLVATTNPDSTVSVNWEKDPWADWYHVYYGTDPNVVANDPITGFAHSQSSSTGVTNSAVIVNLNPHTPYYFAVSSIYSSPADLASCQSSASAAVMPGKAPPTVTGMSPNTGAAGTVVTIAGVNFDTTPANNAVMFNATQATVTGSTATSLTVTVPDGATTGPVSVSSAGSAIASAGNFTVTSPKGETCVTRNHSAFNYQYEKYCYYLNGAGKEIRHGLYERFNFDNNQIVERKTYVDGVLNGPAQFYDSEYLQTAAYGTYYLGAEGSYAKGESTGNWSFFHTNSYNVGVESLGKLSTTVTYGLIGGYTVQAVTNYYCAYDSYVNAAKRGQLASVDTVDLSTGVRTTQLLFKNGCGSQPG